MTVFPEVVQILLFLQKKLFKIGIKVIAVSQEVDTTTATGKFQKNIMLMFGQFDNDQRRDKSTTGMRENLRQGYWINSTPFGYTNLHKKEKAKNHKYIINKDGKLLKKAFELKAEARLTDKEIDRVQTSRTNSIFEAISLLAKDFDKNKNAPLIKQRQNSHSVGAARFELATSTSQMWRDNRATLRPDFLRLSFMLRLRRGWDSNPRYSLTRTTI